MTLCDASTRFMRNNINIYVWRALGTRAGEEPYTVGN